MPAKKQFYTDEFKQQIVDLFRSGKRKVDIIREYGISESALTKWIKRADNSGCFDAKSNRTPQEEDLIALQKELKQLRMENDILKQAALILGRK